MGSASPALWIKQPGRCCCCATDCREIRQTLPLDHATMPGYPIRIGRQLECGTEVEFLLADGTTTHLTFCLACAHRLRPEEYGPLWESVLDLTDRSLQRLDRSNNERKVVLATLARQWPIAVLFRRRINYETTPATPVIDRRPSADGDA